MSNPLDPYANQQIDVDAFVAWCAARGALRLDDLRAYVETLNRDGPRLRLNPALAVSQSLHECADRETASKVYVSVPWTYGLNPAGIGVESDALWRVYDFGTGEHAARVQLLQLFIYFHGTDLPEGFSASESPRWPVTIAAKPSRIACATTVEDLNGTWATDDTYAAGITKWYARILAAGIISEPAPKPTGDIPVVTTPTKPTAATHKAYTVPGGKRSLLLPAWIKVQIKPVDLEGVRSYTKSGAKTMTTVHDTGNPRTNAQAEYEWLAAGRPGGVVGGYEWITDDTGVIVTGWFDEDTWAQGVANGNRISHAGEMAFGGSVVWTTALEVTCAMHGAVLEMEDRISDAAAVLHQYWTGKWCAGQILNRGIWPEVRAKILAYARAARAYRNGQPVTDIPATTYPQTYVPIDPATGKAWDGSADVEVNGVKFEAQRTTAKTLGVLNQRQWASTESLPVAEALAEGTSVELLGWVAGELVDGISEWWITADGARLWAGGIDVQPKVDPDYGQQPEPPTGGVDLPAQGPVPVNGRLYYPLFDEASEEAGEPVLGRKITVERPGNLYKWADTTTPIVGTVTPAAAGQPPVEHVFRYWTRGEELPLTMKNVAGETVTVGEPIWYAEDLYTGARMWSGLSTERPD